jgi:hypothetical protein
LASISQDPIPVFLYADDIALLADSAQQMQAMLSVCEKWAPLFLRLDGCATVWSYAGP